MREVSLQVAYPDTSKISCGSGDCEGRTRAAAYGHGNDGELAPAARTTIAPDAPGANLTLIW
jgi:hypothetical protein